MDCLICKAKATRIQTMGDWVELRCAGCGHYRVSGAFFAEMKAHDQSFDVEKTREWLDQQRKVPMIGSCDNDLIARWRPHLNIG